ncbi:MAG: nitroreductase [Pseudomonadota bacterium]
MANEAMTIDAALKARISIRAFTSAPVAEETVAEILEIARFAPSGGNLQPWKVIAVAGAAREAVIALGLKTVQANPLGEAEERPIYPKPLGEPYRTRRYEIGEAMYEKLGVARDDKAARLLWLSENYRFFGAPVGLFFVIDRSMGHGQWAHLGMFMQSIALAAAARGLGTCMQEAWAMARKSLHAHFSLPENEILYCGMALGHPDWAAPVNSLRSERAALAEIATFQGF